MKFWRNILVMTVALLSLASCSSDDDDKISEEQKTQQLLEMRNEYQGNLRISMENETDKLLETKTGFSVESNKTLKFSLPLDQIVAQIQDEAIAQAVSEIGSVTVTADYEFLNIDGGGAHFMLHPTMVPTEETAKPLTRTQPVEYKGLTLIFSNNYGGDYVTENGALIFNLCVTQVYIDNVVLEGFQPVHFHYSGTSEFVE